MVVYNFFFIICKNNSIFVLILHVIMKYYLNILLLCFVISVYSQGIRNDNAHIVMSNTSHIVIDGNGNWTNNGGTFTAGSSTVDFIGNVNQTIQGSSSTTFYNLTINKSGGDLLVAVNTDVSNNLTMTSGDLDLQNSTVSLGSTGVIVSETEVNRIKVGDPTTNTGTITYTRTINNVSNYDPVNLGIEISTPANLGTITVVRGHLIQTGTFGGTATQGVARYYEVPGIGQLDVSGGISVNMHYWDAELNGLTEANIEGYHWVTEGSSSSWWTPLDGSVNTSANLFTTSGDPYGAYFTTSTWYGFTWSDRFTLGSKDSPLPVELKALSASCHDNGILIEWTTASEINNDYFTLEKSNDAENFYVIATIQGNGNSNVSNNYEYFDFSEKQAYYRLSQTDFNGITHTFNIIYQSCTNGDVVDANMNIINNPASEHVQLQLTGKENASYTLSFINQLGQQLIEKEIVLENTTQKVTINTRTLSEGIYSVVFRSENNIITKQLVITKK